MIELLDSDAMPASLASIAGEANDAGIAIAALREGVEPMSRPDQVDSRNGRCARTFGARARERILAFAGPFVAEPARGVGSVHNRHTTMWASKRFAA